MRGEGLHRLVNGVRQPFQRGAGFDELIARQSGLAQAVLDRQQFGGEGLECGAAAGTTNGICIVPENGAGQVSQAYIVWEE